MTFQIMKAVRRPRPNVKTRLRSFLDANEPQVVRMLSRVWNKQARDISYGDLIRAIERNEIDEAWLDDWRQDYSRFVAGYLSPAWETSMQAAADALHQKYPRWFFDPAAEGAQRWVQRHGAEFVTNVTRTQIEGIRAAVKYAASGAMTVDKLAQIVRPMVGLTRPQTTALSHYLNSMLQQGVTEKTARHKVLRRADSMHRQRAYMIAQTELAYAYNRGALEGIRQAQKLGYIGGIMKIWRTAEDERVCGICETLNNAKIEIDGEFNFPTRLRDDGIREMPPAHPRCRCAVAFEEITTEGARTVVDYGEEVKGNEPVRLIPESAKVLMQSPNKEADSKKEELPMLKYMAKDKQGNLLKNQQGVPILLIEFMKEDYQELLQSLPKGSKIKKDLGEAFAKVKYQDINQLNPIPPFLRDVSFGYLPFDYLGYPGNTLYYDTTHKSFMKYDFEGTISHELAHIIDSTKIHTEQNKEFSEAIQMYRTIFSSTEVLMECLKFCDDEENDSGGFVLDILDAICESEIPFFSTRKDGYWKQQGKKEQEIFANLIALTVKKDAKSLDFLAKYFPQIIKAFHKFGY